MSTIHTQPPSFASLEDAPIAVACAGLRKSFGEVRAVDGLDLRVPQSSVCALLGPSGCGKTTMLRLVAGFERPDAGSVRVGDRVVADGSTFVAPERRRIGMVFQDYALFPHMNVAANIAYALAGAPRAARAARVKEVLSLVGLESAAGRGVHELSGGQQQRVALARALAPTPELILLDEPFSNLDASLRDRLRREMREILGLAGVTAIFVTHDQEEALSLADVVAVMRDGRIEQAGTPEEVYGTPAGAWVAEFVGDTDVLRGESIDGEVRCELFTLALDPGFRGPANVLVRPESIAVGSRPSGAAKGAVEATVVGREFYGHDQLVELELPSGQRVRSRRLGFPSWHPGDRVRVWLEGPVNVMPRSSSSVG